MLVDRGGSFIDLDANCGSLEGATALHLATLAASEPSVLHLLGAGVLAELIKCSSSFCLILHS